ncbi:MAG: acyltransferase [Chitinophagaceae bacterium]|nr:MAG: acyltransferase [Chitinophagaceae bacterium]
MAKTRVGVLDALRGIAAMAVVFYHYTFMFRARYGHSFDESLDFTIGKYGVQLFFVISGFVIFMTAERVKSGKEFLFRRFIRLYPIYWFCLLFSLVIPAAVHPGDTAPFTFQQVLLNLTMFQTAFKVPSIDGVYWSLFPELMFYAVILLLLLVKQLRNIYLWIPLWLAVSAASGLFNLHIADFLFRYAGLFSAGIFFYRIYNGDKKLVNHLGILACYLVVIVNESEVLNLSTFNLPILGVFLIFYGFVYHKLGFLDLAFLRFFGYISYPLYLIHQEFGYAVLLQLRSIGLTAYGWIFVPMILSIGFAWLIARYLEKPVLNYARPRLEARLFPRGLKQG